MFGCNMYWRTVLICLFLHVAVSVLAQNRNTPGDRNFTTADVLRHLSKVGGRTTRPGDGTGKPVRVNASVEIQTFRSVNDKKMEFSVDLFIRLTWNDPRLTYESGPASVILSTESAAKLLWVPDVSFSNAHESQLHGLSGDSVLYRVGANGDVFFQARSHANFHCYLDLGSFPMDTNECDMVLQSYTYTKSDVELVWEVGAKAFQFPANSRPKSFSVTRLHRGNCSKDLADEFQPCLYASVTMKRLPRRWFLLVYAPSILVLLLSCLVFWIPPSARLERTVYVSVLMLTMMAVLAGSLVLSPADGEVKAMDVWVLVCFVFIAIATSEVVVMHLLSPPLDRGRSDSFELMKDEDSSRLAQRAKDDTVWNVRPNILRKVDLIMRFAYPAIFGLFNAIYWGTYSS